MQHLQTRRRGAASIRRKQACQSIVQSVVALALLLLCSCFALASGSAFAFAFASAAAVGKCQSKSVKSTRDAKKTRGSDVLVGSLSTRHGLSKKISLFLCMASDEFGDFVVNYGGRRPSTRTW